MEWWDLPAVISMRKAYGELGTSCCRVGPTKWYVAAWSLHTDLQPQQPNILPNHMITLVLRKWWESKMKNGLFSGLDLLENLHDPCCSCRPLPQIMLKCNNLVLEFTEWLNILQHCLFLLFCGGQKGTAQTWEDWKVSLLRVHDAKYPNILKKEI